MVEGELLSFKKKDITLFHQWSVLTPKPSNEVGLGKLTVLTIKVHDYFLNTSKPSRDHGESNNSRKTRCKPETLHIGQGTSWYQGLHRSRLAEGRSLWVSTLPGPQSVCRNLYIHIHPFLCIPDECFNSFICVMASRAHQKDTYPSTLWCFQAKDKIQGPVFTIPLHSRCRRRRESRETTAESAPRYVLRRHSYSILWRQRVNDGMWQVSVWSRSANQQKATRNKGLVSYSYCRDERWGGEGRHMLLWAFSALSVRLYAPYRSLIWTYDITAISFGTGVSSLWILSLNQHQYYPSWDPSTWGLVRSWCICRCSMCMRFYCAV